MRKLFVLFLLLAPCVFADPTLIRPDLVIRPDFQEVMDKAIDFLVTRQKPDGSFTYDHLPFEGRTIFKGETGYLVRVAGVFYSLALAYDGENEKVKGSLDKAIKFFKDNSIEYEMNGRKLRIVSENNEGLTGVLCLFLSGYFYLHHMYPEQFKLDSPHYVQFMDTLEYYSDHDAGLTHYINIEETYVEKVGRVAEPYASAQHFLTLSLFHLTFKRKFLHPKLKQYIRLYNRKWEYGILPQSYHWVMQAYYFLFLIDNEELRQLIPSQIENLQQAYLSHFPIEKTMKNNCSVAEGLGTYYRYRQEVGSLNRADMYQFADMLRHLKNFQIKEGIKRKVEKDGQVSYKPLKDPHLSVGGFYHREDGKYHTRIDFTQHCLSAYLSYDFIYKGISENFEALLARWDMEKIQRHKVAQDNPLPQKKTKMHRVLLKELRY